MIEFDEAQYKELLQEMANLPPSAGYNGLQQFNGRFWIAKKRTALNDKGELILEDCWEMAAVDGKPLGVFAVK